ncbi:hypothetical protein E6Q11_00405 [Candidatus Dojkabacteria bacterium]|uniref:Uncharacterized protein n=1 Tax=Candidatus Dojkabacteria bacterium TaxID=2099670 RepID=A0A5C7JAZ3_9BACT|nr:MAG: hypothetical protein E6Q11_00405 [Candidatus Dojkabacteria bacterium]
MTKTFKKPDLNAPRFRSKRMNMLTKDLHARFLSKFPEYEGLSLQQFKEIITTFNGKLYQGVIDNRDGVELPEGLGFIFMGSCPPAKKQNIDIVKSLQYGVVANHKNWDSDNKLMKLFYTNRPSKYPFQNKQIWAFKAVKQFRKAASEAFREDWPRYIVVDNTKKISTMFAKIRKTDFINKHSSVIPENWDEFKM